MSTAQEPKRNRNLSKKKKKKTYINELGSIHILLSFHGRPQTLMTLCSLMLHNEAEDPGKHWIPDPQTVIKWICVILSQQASGNLLHSDS